jgi:GAF domain-containing protein
MSHPESGAPDPTMPRAAALSRGTVGTAIALLRQQHDLESADRALELLRQTSQRHNVKLREVAAAVLGECATRRGASQNRRHRAKATTPPALPFPAGSPAAQPNRTVVLHELMRSVVALTAAVGSTVHVRDWVHGGLRIEGHRGFGRDFLDFFSYVDHHGCACGDTLLHEKQVAVDDVASSPVFSEAARETVLAAGMKSVLSTPLLGRGQIWGVVATYYDHPLHELADPLVRTVQLQANACARWLLWYDKSVMPTIVTGLHRAAAYASDG